MRNLIDNGNVLCDTHDYITLLLSMSFLYQWTSINEQRQSYNTPRSAIFIVPHSRECPLGERGLHLTLERELRNPRCPGSSPRPYSNGGVVFSGLLSGSDTADVWLEWATLSRAPLLFSLLSLPSLRFPNTKWRRRRKWVRSQPPWYTQTHPQLSLSLTHTLTTACRLP